jgi:hypothetical protein
LRDGRSDVYDLPDLPSSRLLGRSHLIFGYEQYDVPGFGQQHDWIDGIGAYFHPGCSPGLPRYREAPRTAA